ncbi:hypothetical protein SOVF_107260 [Spinacia oleracea]|uniref:peroxidase n=1 Tax=Spinacia oleracea TaxID=3562 RepID=A0A9R0I6M7_SPIOL|nr:peroxidase 60-like [Spinacia oleracea]KNA14471.1 hypothetical protein SOVF_107260 [Spinacia oleracea]
MSLPSLATLLAKTISIWLILVLSHVIECHGSRLPERRSRLGDRGKLDGQLRSRLLLSPEADSPFSSFSPFWPESSDPPFSPFWPESSDPPFSPFWPESSDPPFSPFTPFSPIISPTNPSIPPSSPPVESSSTPSISISPLASPPTQSSTPSIDSNSSSNPSRPSGLQVGFYRGQCPNKNVDVEATITAKVQQHFLKDETLLPALLRMQFHDCFVHGCDASILIDGPSSEKTALPNLSVRGYQLIDALKDAAEAECPGIVSCADIIAIATKQLIKLGGGQEYPVQTGRRDGVVSVSQDVMLPSPFASVQETISAFAAENFNPEEMVLLFGGHTVGKSHCTFFQDRLYEDANQFDPNMDADLRRQLSLTCPKGTTADNFAFLDQNTQSSNIFDNSFFDQILKGRGILPIDQELARDPQTSAFVLQFARNPNLFNAKFANAMVKLQSLGIHTSDHGEIRKVCSQIN